MFRSNKLASLFIIAATVLAINAIGPTPSSRAGTPDASTQMAITATPDPVSPGQTVQYAVTVTNRTTTGNNYYQIEAQVPRGMTVPVADIGQSGFCATAFATACEAGAVIRWTNIPIAPGQTTTLQFAALVNATNALPNGTVVRSTATARVTNGSGSGATAAVDTMVATNGLSLGMVNNPGQVAPGGTLTYTLRFGNSSTASSANAVLLMPLPAGTSFVSASNGATSTGGIVRWNVAALPPGGSGQEQLVVNVNPQAANGSLVTATSELSDAATARSLARANAATAVVTNSGTQMAITATPDPVSPGQTVQYAVTVTNRTTTGNNYYQIEAQVPSGMTVPVANIGQAGFCATAFATACEAGGVIRWTNIPIAPGQSTTLQFAALVNTTNALPSGTVVRSTATARVTNGSASGATAAVDTMVATNGLSLGMVNNPGQVAPGGTLTYTLRFGNSSTASSANAVLAVPLPAGTSFVSASNGATITGGIVQWNVTALPPGGSGQEQLVVNVNPQAANGSLVTATSELRDAATARGLARANAATAVVTNSETQMAITATPDPASPGQTVQYAVTVTNRTATGNNYYQIEAQVPSGMRVPVANIGQSGFCATAFATACEAGGVIRWTNIPIAPGQSTTLQFAALVTTTNALPSGTVVRSTATARVTNGSASGATAAVDTMVATNGLSLGMVNNPGQVAPGGTLTYTLRFGNSSTASSANAVLAVPLPAGNSFVSASNGGTITGGIVRWNVAALPPGGSGQEQLVVNVNPQAANGSLVTATSELRDAATARGLARANAATAVVTNSGTQMAITATPDPASTGQTVQYAVTVTNRTATGNNYYQIEAQVPSGMRVPVANIGQAGFCATAFADACEAGGVIRWTNIPIAPGQSTTLQFAASVNTTNALPSGTVVRSTATARVTNGSASGATAAVDTMVATNGLSLGMVNNPGQVAPGGTLTYSLRFGNSSTASSANAVLAVPLPAGTSFVSASNGGTITGGIVRWGVMALPPGGSGQGQLVVNVNPQAANGSLVTATSELRDAATARSLARADAAAAVLSNSGTQMAITATPDQARPRQTVQYAVTVTNRATAGNNYYQIEAQVPRGTTVPLANIGQSGFCATAFAVACEAGGVIRWTNIPIAPGQSTTLQFAALVTATNALPSGTVVRSTATARVTNGSASGATAAVDIHLVQ